MRTLLLLSFFSIASVIPIQDSLLGLQIKTSHEEEIAYRGHRGGGRHHRRSRSFDRDNLWVHPRSYRRSYRTPNNYRPRYMNRYWYGHYPYYQHYEPYSEFYYNNGGGFSIRFGF